MRRRIARRPLLLRVGPATPLLGGLLTCRGLPPGRLLARPPGLLAVGRLAVARLPGLAGLSLLSCLSCLGMLCRRGLLTGRAELWLTELLGRLLAVGRLPRLLLGEGLPVLAERGLAVSGLLLAVGRLLRVRRLRRLAVGRLSLRPRLRP
jgi:hypothetical protein